MIVLLQGFGDLSERVLKVIIHVVLLGIFYILILVVFVNKSKAVSIWDGPIFLVEMAST